jgi:L-fuculose-phosphate aldolase
MSGAAARELVACSREMVRRGLVVGTVGNVSVRLENRILITPTRTRYERLGPKDVVAVGPSGERLAGTAQPSNELPLHLAVYRARPDVSAVVHTHSPNATAWSFLGVPIHPTTEENAYYGIGEVRTSAPGPAGSEELAEGAAAALGDSAAVLLGRHGVLAVGAELDEALEIAAVVERQAKIALLLRA